ncbi:MAG: hypothetical protein ACRBM6_00410 [Geminicoccales bacterium]
MSETDHPSKEVDDSEWLDKKFYFYLGSQLVAATLLLVAIAAIPLYMTNDHSTDRSLRTDQRADETWKRENIHPDFAFDELPFTIEPAAGPSNLD